MQSTTLGDISRIILPVLSLSPLVYAQVGQILDKSKLPSCAFNCQLLTQAQSLCVPPVAPTADPAIYQTCFCNSNYLAPFKAGSTAGVCDAECSAASDLTQIEQWFTQLCTGGAVVIPNNGVATTIGTATSAVASDTGTSSSLTSSGSRTGHKSWIEQHYRWIIMLIVLFIAAIAGIFFGLHFKRKYDRRNALGGHHHPSMLAADEAAQSLRDRHPSNAPMKGQNGMSQVQLPPMTSTAERSKGSLPSRGVTASSMGTRSERMNGDVERSAGAGVSSEPSDELPARPGSRLKKSATRD